jgi:hypothetical protein
MDRLDKVMMNTISHTQRNMTYLNKKAAKIPPPQRTINLSDAYYSYSIKVGPALFSSTEKQPLN